MRTDYVKIPIQIENKRLKDNVQRIFLLIYEISLIFIFIYYFLFLNVVLRAITCYFYKFKNTLIIIIIFLYYFNQNKFYLFKKLLKKFEKI